MRDLMVCQNLSKQYGKGVTALNDVSFSLDSGRIVGLLGPNGSGKTTLLIDRAAATGEQIIVADAKRAEFVKLLARQYGKEIKEPIKESLRASLAANKIKSDEEYAARKLERQQKPNRKSYELSL